MKHKFSIIVPVYNAQKRLKVCIDSILKENYPDFEVLLVNDGSTDLSSKILETYKDNPKVQIFNNKNGGVSKARNNGIMMATGDYILFVDSDDSIKSDMLEKYEKVLEENPCDLIISKVALKTESGQVLNENPLEIHGGAKRVPDMAHDFGTWYRNCLLNSPCSKCYKTSLMNSLFAEHLSLGEDLIFNLEFLSNCEDIYFLDEPLYERFFDEKANSLSTKYSDKGFLDLTYVYEKSTQLINEIWQKQVDLAAVKNKYITDCCTMCERLSLEKDLPLKLKRRMLCEKSDSTFKKEGLTGTSTTYGKKIDLYYYLLRKKRTLSFILLIKFVKLTKRILRH